jgi:hypothetical protein
MRLEADTAGLWHSDLGNETTLDCRSFLFGSCWRGRNRNCPRTCCRHTSRPSQCATLRGRVISSTTVSPRGHREASGEGMSRARIVEWTTTLLMLVQEKGQRIGQAGGIARLKERGIGTVAGYLGPVAAGSASIACPRLMPGVDLFLAAGRGFPRVECPAASRATSACASH